MSFEWQSRFAEETCATAHLLGLLQLECMSTQPSTQPRLLCVATILSGYFFAIQGHTGAGPLPPRPIPSVAPSVASGDEDLDSGANAGGRKLSRAERIAEQQAARNQRLGKRGPGSREDDTVDPMDPVSWRGGVGGGCGVQGLPAPALLTIHVRFTGVPALPVKASQPGTCSPGWILTLRCVCCCLLPCSPLTRMRQEGAGALAWRGHSPELQTQLPQGLCSSSAPTHHLGRCSGTIPSCCRASRLSAVNYS
jgi:hypothetical protein